MEHAPLRDSELMILTQVTNTPTVNPDSMIGEFCMNTGKLVYISLRVYFIDLQINKQIQINIEN